MKQGPAKETSYALKRKAGLVPSRYSAEYHAWCEAIKSTDGYRIAKANEDWRRMITRRYGYGNANSQMREAA